jgi:stearoyl-CoA desaturase (delta-9 desaturase)
LSGHFLKIIIPVHLFAIVAFAFLFMGVIETKWLWLTLAGWILISGFGVAIGFHRLISHNAFETHPFVRKVLAYLGSMGAQGSPVFWASLHNGLHHPFSDTERDLHSPVHGKFNSYIGWQIYLRPEAIPFRIGARLIREPFLKFLHKNYNLIFWGSILAVALVSWKAALCALVLPAFISVHQENMIDLFCHLPGAGYRNHKTNDRSVNNFVLGYLAFGQGWHNNHHARPADFNFGGDRWWEFDICSVLVPVLSVRKKSDVG